MRHRNASRRIRQRGQALLLIVVLAIAGWQARRWVDEHYPQHAPWTPLHLSDPVGMATRIKLAALAGNKPQCLTLFDGSSYRIKPRADRMLSASCGYVDAVAMERMSAFYRMPDHTIACPLAASLAVWERHVVQPAANQFFDSRVARIDTFGVYNCRRIAGSSRWSRHATAEAIDIAGFVLADGTRIDMARDWHRVDARGQFLKSLRDGGCAIFGTVLSPDYNRAHRDHFHLQTHGLGTCR